MPDGIISNVAINLASGLLQEGMKLAGKHGYRNIRDVIRRGEPSQNRDVLRATHGAYVAAMRVMAKASREVATDRESRAAARALDALTDEATFSAFRWDGEHFPYEETSAAIDRMFARADAETEEDLLIRYDEIIICDLEIWGVELTPTLRDLFLYGWGRHQPWHRTFHEEFAEAVKTNQRAFRILTFEALTELRAGGARIRDDIAFVLEQMAKLGSKLDGQTEILTGHTEILIETRQIVRQLAGVELHGGTDTTRQAFAGSAMSGDSTGSGEPRPSGPRKEGNPYRDLAYFDVDDAAHFYGRDEDGAHAARLISTILDGNAQPAGLCIAGPTGSGKTSFLRASVLHRVRAVAGAKRHIAILRPDDFSDGISVAMRIFGEISEQTDLPIPAQALLPCATLQGSAAIEHMCDALAKALGNSGGKLVFAFDQLEEIVDFWADSGTEHSADRKYWTPLFEFIAALGLRKLGCAIYTLESNRFDIIGRCHPAAVFDQAAVHRIEVNSERGEFFRQVIEGPFAAAGYYLAPSLVQRLAHEVDLLNRQSGLGERLAVLPLLSLRLSKLYDFVEQRFKPVDPSGLNFKDPDIDGSGFVRIADIKSGTPSKPSPFLTALGDEISLLADAAWARGTGKFKPAEDDLDILIPFVGLAGSSTDLIRLKSVSPSSLKYWAALLQQMLESRLVIERHGRHRLTHEAIIRNWPPASAWLERKAPILREEETLRLRAMLWDREGRSDIVDPDAKLIQSAGNILSIYRPFWERDQSDLPDEDALFKDFCLAVIAHLREPRQMFEGVPATGLTALYGLTEVLERLLDVDPSAIEAKSEKGEATPLICAGWSHPKTVAALLARGANLGAKDKDGFGILSPPIYGNNERAFELLLMAMGDSIPSSPMGTVLHECASAGTVYMARRILAAGLVDPNTPGFEDWLPIHFAARDGKFEAFRYFSGLNDPFAKTSTQAEPLHLAASRGHAAIVDELLAHAEYPRHAGAIDNLGFNALHYAAFGRHAHLVQRLTGAVDVNAKVSKGYHDGASPLILAVAPDGFDRKASEPAILRTVEALLSCSDADPNLQDAKGQTALSLSFDLPRVERLLLSDERLDLLKDYGATAQHPIAIAGERRHKKVVRRMLERAPRDDPSGWSPIPYLCAAPDVDDEMVEMALADWPPSTDLAKQLLTETRVRDHSITAGLLERVERLEAAAITPFQQMVGRKYPFEVVKAFAAKIDRAWSTPYFGSWTILHRLCASQALDRLELYRPLYESDPQVWQMIDATGRTPADLLTQASLERFTLDMPATKTSLTVQGAWDVNCGWTLMTGEELEYFEGLDLEFERSSETRIDVTELRFYPASVKLVRVSDLSFEPGGVCLYWLMREQKLFSLTGLSLPIHQMNELGPIQLDPSNLDVVIDYLRFFCFFVRGDDGPFVSFEQVGQTGYPKNLSKEDTELVAMFPAPPIAEYDVEKGLFRLGANIFYGHAAFASDLEIQSSGMIDMLRDYPLTPDLSAAPDVPLQLVRSLT